MRVAICTACRVSAVCWGTDAPFCIGCQRAANEYERRRGIAASLMARWGFVLWGESGSGTDGREAAA